MSRPLLHTLLLVLGLLVAKARPLHAEEFALRDGDRVVFYGDSIAEQRLYTTLVETYVLSRFPERSIRFFDAGWAGDTAAGWGAGGVDVRLKRDVLPHRPTVVVVMFGMNDAYYYKVDEKIERLYADNLRAIVRELRQALPDVRITLCQTSPYDNVTRPSADDWEKAIDGGYNSVLIRYGRQVPRLADEERCATADFNATLVDVLKRAHALDPSNAAKIIPDRIHPARAGALAMAAALLQAWHAPGPAAVMEIDAKQDLAWSRADDALPIPLDQKDPAMMLVATLEPASRFCQQPLKVPDLSSGSYELLIDAERVGTFTNDELGVGINIARLPTPMMKQAVALHELTTKRSDLAFARWRTVQVPFADLANEETARAAEELTRLEEKVITLQRSAARPKTHRFELRPTTAPAPSQPVRP